MEHVNQVLDWMFAVPEGERTVDDIITWWERRRLAYNLIVGITGIISFAVFLVCIIASGTLGPGEDAEEPIMGLFIAPFIINICYTLGWIVEISRQSNIFPRTDRTIGPRLLKMGLVFSLALVSFPAVFWALFLALQWLGIVSRGQAQPDLPWRSTERLDVKATWPAIRRQCRCTY